MTERQKKRLQHLLVLAALTIAGVWLHRGHFSEEPSGIHTWTQSDHYALARGFQENGLNFFRPETFAYHENPGKQPSTVTAVDFPIHNYIPAVFMKLFGTESPAIYRWYLFLVSIIGLFYLYRLAYLLNKSMALSLLIVFFAAASPVFTFYQIRFIPSVPTFSTAIIGFYYYFVYRQNQQLRTLAVALGFLTLSALTRMTFLLPLLAVCGQEFIFVLRSEKLRWKKLGLLITSGVLFLSYTLYNTYLRTQFGGIFLTTFMPADNLHDLIQITREVLRIWKWEYLTRMHYVLLGLGLLVALYHIFIRKTANPVFPGNWLLITFLLLGCTTFYILMVGQFPAHDYYFIDNFLVPLLVILCLASGWIAPKGKIGRFVLCITAVAGTLWMLNVDWLTQNRRHERELFGHNAQVIANFKDGDQLLNRLGISEKETIVVLDPSPCNVPLLSLHRKGYVNMQNNTTALDRALKLPCRYYVFQNVLFPQSIYKFYPQIIGKMEVMGTNGKITVCRKRKSDTKSLMTFLKLDKQQSAFELLAGRNGDKWSWETGKFDSIQRCFEADPADEFDPSLGISDPDFFKNGRLIILDGEINFPKDEDLEWVFSFTVDGKLKTYETYSLQYALTGKGPWKQFLLFLQAPACEGKGDMATYLYNTKHLRYQYRNLRCRIY